MSEWGSIPDWVNVAIAFLALLGFVVVEREKLILGKRKTPANNENKLSETDYENEQSSITENNIDFRAELYSRILLGVILGIALTPIFSWAFAGVFHGLEYDYDTLDIVRSTTNVVGAITLSLALSFVYLRAYSSWASVFVHWAERLAFAYLGLWVMLGFMYVSADYQTDISYMNIDTFVNIIVSVIILLLIGFASTPIDWIIQIANKTKGEKSG